jgi:putative FmdB family regulatory protein
MPTYEYRCANGHEFEQFQRMSEEPLRVCTVCGAAAERIMSAGAGLLFKGSGFYITDYRSDSYRKAADADSGGSAKKDAPSSDAAPAKDAAKSSGSSGSAPARPE